jgi:hypothetical protein
MELAEKVLNRLDIIKPFDQTSSKALYSSYICGIPLPLICLMQEWA